MKTERRLVLRRSFLKAALAAPGAVLAASCGDAKPAEQAARPPLLVAGGGLAGLVLLHRLVRAGHPATLLEAQDRLGGRILTLRNGLPDGLRAEAGAERVRKNHHAVRALLTELGIATVNPPSGGPPHAFHLEGKTYRFRATGDLPSAIFEGLSAKEKSGAPFDVAASLSSGAPMPDADDPRTGMQWLRDLGLTVRGEVFVSAYCTHPLTRMSAAALARILAAKRDGGSHEEFIADGTDRIVAALARHHEGRIIKGAPVVRVREDAAEVVVTDAQGRDHRAAALALCLPPGPLARVEFPQGRPGVVDDRLKSLGTAREFKVALQLPASAFGDDKAALFTIRDRWPRAAWPMPETAASGARVINAMLFEDEAVEAGTAAAAGGTALRDLLLARMPEVAKDSTKILAHDFNVDPWSLGTYAYAKRGSANPGTTLRAGRIHFAGSEFSEFSGWMEGAVRSAEDCAREMLAS